MFVDALLCDAATVREGLLHILGGGINRLMRKKFPAPLGCVLAMVLEVEAEDIGKKHAVVLEIKDENDEQIAKIGADMQMGSEKGLPANVETLNVPLVLSLQGVGVPKSGEYTVNIIINEEHHRTLSVFIQGPPPGEEAKATEE